VVLDAAVLRGEFKVVGTVAMNPWSSRRNGWSGATTQDGPTLIFGGSRDTVAPVSTDTLPAWRAVVTAGRPAILAVLNGGTHNSEAWGPVGRGPRTCDFGRYQQPSTLWWRWIFRHDAPALAQLLSMLGNRIPTPFGIDCGGYPALGIPNWSTLAAGGSGTLPP
jgi:hypothetical protein